MKRLAILIGGLLVLPAFAEVAPVFIEDEGALEYADGMYDENGFLVAPEEFIETGAETTAPETQTPVKISRAPVNATPVANRTTSTRATPTATKGAASGRGTATGNSSRVVAARTTTSGRTDASRAVASRGATTSPRAGTATATTRATTSSAATRAAAARTTGGAARATTSNTGATVARTATTAGRTATTTRAGAARTATATTARAATATDRVSIRQNIDFGAGAKTNQVSALGAVNTSMDPLYKSASTRRTPTIRMSSLNGVSTETTSVSTMSLEDMDDLAELTDYCKAQYANCMDNYCNVLDDNQGRCSCSANIKDYAKTEAALKTATEELQDVAQKIQYIGLTSREVETLFTETIAEETMRTSGTDTSQLQASLNKIKDMIIDVKSGTTTSSASNDLLGLNFDLSGLLEFSFDSTGFDLGSLFGTTNTGSVSNQRGDQLYKTAAARCKSSVLKACTARGVDASLVTNAYDLEIDRECMAYERSLNDSNDQMLATVRNAKNVLQKARLMVAQQKNAYDMRGCINALDSCMQDEFVCGSDYENCLDPTGRYIVNGAIVVGSQPGHAIDPELSNNVASVMTSDVCRVNLYRTWDFESGQCRAHNSSDPEYGQGSEFANNYMSNPTYDQGNAWGSGPNDTLSKYIEKTVTSSYPSKTSENMSLYLQNKIGYNQKDRNYGMCMSVLNKCQDYTYTRGTGTSAQYEPANQVVQQYLAHVLVQIKAKQDEILANYAETCVSDVTTCLSQNGYPTEDPNDWETTEYSTNRTKMNIAVNACRAQIVTCMSVNGYSIDTPTPTEMNCWVQGLLYSTSTDECMRNNLKQDCNDGQKLCNGECIDESEICEQPVQQYYVSLECGSGCDGSKSVNGNFDAGSNVNVPMCGTSQKPNVTWGCTQPSSNFSVQSGQKLNVQNNISCSATCTANNPEPPSPTEYVVNIDCGGLGTFTNHGKTSQPINTCPEVYQCGKITFTDECINLSDYCSMNNSYAGSEYKWTCNGSQVEGDEQESEFCPTSAVSSCSLSAKAPGGTSDPEWVTVNLNYGTQAGNSGLVTANQTRLYLDIYGHCPMVYSSTTPGGDSQCPDTDVYAISPVPHMTSFDPEFTGFWNNGTQYINENGQITNAFYGITNNMTLTAQWQPASTGTGGMRYVQINDGDGVRTSLRKGNAYQLNAVWIDTDGSTCQERGVYIADPNNNNMLVCSSPVDTIGWWKSPGKRSSGFYINVGGTDVLFAREWGEIVTENIGQFAATDPDATLTATPKVYGNDVGYVYFDETNHTWNATYTPPSDEYYVHNKFDINFYPNRPGLSGNNTDPTGIYRYVEGKGYYAENGSNRTTAPTITESGYTFRGFYPGKLSAVSDNDMNGMVWPATTGGQSPVSLNNLKWVLATMNPNFNGLNLYAAWAKNCPSQLPNGMQKCNLTIGTNGSVTYAVECQDGYEQIGSGADAECIIQGSNWRSVEFAGATAAY